MVRSRGSRLEREVPGLTDPVVARTYEVEFSDGSAIRVDIPETWKVTYGPIIGAGAQAGDGTSIRRGKPSYGGNAFRAWEAENKQRLLLTGVTSFRDTSLPMMRRAVRKFGSTTWVEDDGSWKGTKALDVEKRWVPVEDDTVEVPEDAS